MNKSSIEYSDFEKVEIRLGTIIAAENYDNLLKPSIVLKIDFGNNIGVKKSSAQLQSNYDVDELINRQVLAVINFKPKQIGKIISEVLVLGLPDDNDEPILVSPDKYLKNGRKLY